MAISTKVTVTFIHSKSIIRVVWTPINEKLVTDIKVTTDGCICIDCSSVGFEEIRIDFPPYKEVRIRVRVLNIIPTVPSSVIIILR